MNHTLVERLYAALRTGDRAGVAELLHPEFVGRMTEGMPVAGGEHIGPQAAIDDGWWTLGRHFKVAAEPEEWIDATDGRLVVTGTYRGRARSTGKPFTAVFAHVFSERDGRIATLDQITDAAGWSAALLED